MAQKPSWVMTGVDQRISSRILNWSSVEHTPRLPRGLGLHISTCGLNVSEDQVLCQSVRLLCQVSRSFILHSTLAFL